MVHTDDRSADRRPWLPAESDAFLAETARRVAASDADALAARLTALARDNRTIHERDCFNLDPAANAMNPAAEAMLAAGLGSRPSLGAPRAKYETGLEAIEEIEAIAAALAAETFAARYAEIRPLSGAMANLMAFMATCRPGDSIIAPPAEIGGHVTHHALGCAGLYGLSVHAAPIDAARYSVDVAALVDLAARVRPKLITIGGSLNLWPHPVAELRAVADAVGARLLVDAAHQCGVIAGRAWPNPLRDGAHLMTMSTYKSLAGPPGGLIVTDDADLAAKLDAIAFPGMTANSDAGRAAALAMTLLDWREHGQAYAAAMTEAARALARALADAGAPVFGFERGATTSHQLALEAAAYGGGQSAARRIRAAGFLACGIGLPIAPVEGDANGLRLGASELVRWGVGPDDMPEIARLLAQALTAAEPSALAPEVARLRRRFDRLRFVRAAA